MTCFWPFWMNVSKMEYKCTAAAQRNSSQNWCENLSGLGIPFNSLRSRTSMLFSTFWWILSCWSILAWNACAILAVACVCWLADSSSACWSCCCPWVSCSVICLLILAGCLPVGLLVAGPFRLSYLWACLNWSSSAETLTVVDAGSQNSSSATMQRSFGLLSKELKNKLPTIWTVEKQMRQAVKSEGRRCTSAKVRRKKIHLREMLGQSRNAVFFQWFVCRVSRKVGLLKRRVRR